jgi:hypothetical protein
MKGKTQTYRRGDKKKSLIFIIIFILLITSTALTLSATPPSKKASVAPDTVYVTTDGSGEFNCDGSDDQVEINKALEYITENPQFTTVYLRGPATYVISDSILIGSDTVLEGDSTAVIKLKDKADWEADKPLITQMDDSGNRNIIIRGFEIDGNHDKNADKSRGKGYYNLMYFINSENIQVHDMYMHDSHGDGLKVVRSSGIQFYNNKVYKLGHDGLYALYSSNLGAWNNKITCRTNSGLRIYNTNHVKFYNNIITSEGEGGAGIEIQKSGSSTVMNDIEIYNNLIYQTNAAGVWITGYGSDYSKDSAKGVYIHHNKFYKVGVDATSDWAGGIVLNGFQNTLIENNKFDECYGAAIAHKQVTSEFLAPESGYTTIVKDNIIINTEPNPSAGKGYAIYNKLKSTHSFVLNNNCLANNVGGNYIDASSTSDVEADPKTAAKLNTNESLGENFSWHEAMSAGPQSSYEIDESGIHIGQQDKSESTLKGDILEFLNSLKRIFLGFFTKTGGNGSFNTFLPLIISDNRLKEDSPNVTLRESEYMDVGKKSDRGIHRDVMIFDLDSFNQTSQIKKTILSLFWYYPENQVRSKDTVLEVYRPEKWCDEHVTWQVRESDTPWKTPGGDWYDKKGVLQGSTPYATITISGGQIPDNRYYDLDVTELVKEYTSGKYENTGFLIKAREEDGDYIAFYSSDWQNKNQRPKLTIEST